MTPTFVYSKTPGDVLRVLADFTALLQTGEAVTSVAINPVQPVTAPAATVTLVSVAGAVATIDLASGVDGVSYGAQVLVTTNARTLTAMVAVAVASAPFVPYTTSTPDAFADLVGTIEAGKAAMAASIFVFPATRDPAGGYVVWELLSADGLVYASGNAFEVKVQSNGLTNTVVARSVINCPSTVPPTLDDQRYQLRYTLNLPPAVGTQPENGALTQDTFYAYESLEVVGLNTVPLGPQPAVEIMGTPATLSIVIDDLYQNISLEILYGNALVYQAQGIANGERTSSGWFYQVSVPTTGLPPSLVPYSAIWRYSKASDPLVVYTERTDLFVITPSISGAITDVLAKINKAHATLYGTPDLLFPPETVMTWLRRGADWFNGAYGKPTNITMTNALGPVREYWLMSAEYFALQSQELAEAEKAFDFQGAAISLTVDRTQAYGSLADKIKGQLDNELKDFKVNLIIKGNDKGDGSGDVTKLQHGAMGTVGITITPATTFAYPGVFQWGRRNDCDRW